MNDSMSVPLLTRLAGAALGIFLLGGLEAAQAPYPPATPRPRELRQPDGTTIKLYFRGSPFYSWYEDTDGYTVVQDGKTYVYARRDSHGDLMPIKDLVVGKAKPAQAGLTRGIRPSAEAIARAREALMKKRQEPSDPGRAGTITDPGSTTSNSPPAHEPNHVEVRQPDGATVKLIDHGGWYQDPGRYAVVRDGDRYVYAVRNSQGQLTPVAGLLVGHVDPAQAGLLKGLRPFDEAPDRK